MSNNSMKNLFAGGLAGYMMGKGMEKKQENFISNDETTMIIVYVVIAIVWILLAVSTFLVMGGGVSGSLHAVMTLFFGSLWITLLWIYKAFTGSHFTK